MLIGNGADNFLILSPLQKDKIMFASKHEKSKISPPRNANIQKGVLEAKLINEDKLE